MTNGDALLASIFAAPDEDTPRLVYADWLDENGQPARAEFIRVQVEIARMVLHARQPLNVETAGLLAREKTLLVTHRENWLAPLYEKGEPLDSGSTHGQFRRGFVEIVWMRATRFLSHAERLFQLCPVRELRVTTRTTPDEFAALLASPFLRMLDSLDLSDVRLGKTAPRIVSHSHFASALRILRLRGCGITDEGAHLLARVPFEWPLRELDVAFNPIGPVGLAALYKRFGTAVRNTL